MNDGEEARVKSILMLPYDLILNCLARVSRFYYPTISLVCKRFHFLITSTELYQTRILLGCTESCLYVCVQLHSTDLLRWFILCQRPNSSKKFLVQISSPHYNSTSMSSVATIGPNIYVIGGGSERRPSSSVMVMDCRSHTWCEAPNMRVARALPSVCTHDEKIYVTGGCNNINSTNWMEIFDIKTQTWEFLRIPSEEICKGIKYQSVRYQETVYVRSLEKNATYKLHKGRWRGADLCMNKRWGWSRSSYCVVENVLYCYTTGRIIRWYDLKERVWRTLKCCLENLPGLSRVSCEDVLLADHGGKLVILWETYVSQKNIIQWAEITLEKRQNWEIWGKLEWSDNAFTIPDEQFKVQALTTTVW